MRINVAERALSELSQVTQRVHKSLCVCVPGTPRVSVGPGSPGAPRPEPRVQLDCLPCKRPAALATALAGCAAATEHSRLHDVVVLFLTPGTDGW